MKMWLTTSQYHTTISPRVIVTISHNCDFIIYTFNDFFLTVVTYILHLSHTMIVYLTIVISRLYQKIGLYMSQLWLYFCLLWFNCYFYLTIMTVFLILNFISQKGWKWLSIQTASDIEKEVSRKCHFPHKTWLLKTSRNHSHSNPLSSQCRSISPA